MFKFGEICFGIGHTKFRVWKLSGKLLQRFQIPMPRHPDNLHPLRNIPSYFGGTLTNGTGGTENDNTTFSHNIKKEGEGRRLPQIKELDIKTEGLLVLKISA